MKQTFNGNFQLFSKQCRKNRTYSTVAVTLRNKILPNIKSLLRCNFFFSINDINREIYHKEQKKRFYIKMIAEFTELSKRIKN
jgi:hypothetical protein